MTELSEARARAVEARDEARNHVENFPISEGDAVRVARLADVIDALLAASAPVEGDERGALRLPWHHQPYGEQNQNGDYSGGSIFDADGEYVVSEVSDIAGAAIVAAVNAFRPSTPTEEDVERAAVAYADHVTGYSMRDGGRTYTCRCGWSETGPEASAAALKHRARAALSAVHPEVTQ